MDYVFGIKSKNSSLSPRSWKFSPKFLLGSFIVLHFTFKSVIRSELTIWGLCQGFICWVTLFLLIHAQLLQHCWWKSRSCWTALASLSKISWACLCGSFAFYSHLIDSSYDLTTASEKEKGWPSTQMNHVTNIIHYLIMKYSMIWRGLITHLWIIPKALWSLWEQSIWPIAHQNISFYLNRKTWGRVHIFFSPRANTRLLKFNFANFIGKRNMIGLCQASFCTSFGRDL